MNSLSYSDLYRITEELQQLVSSKLQAVFNPSPSRYILVLTGFRHLIFDLTATRPFIVSISSTKMKTQNKKTPIFNFIKAHFLDLTIQSIEIAQKPNRTVRIKFENNRELRFKCFPHGQHLLLMADDKVVNFPLRPKENEVVTFVAPELFEHWDFNAEVAGEFLKVGSGTAPTEPAPYDNKLLKKLERALAGLEVGSKAQKLADQERVEFLESQGIKAKGGESQRKLKRFMKKLKD